jgi:hypothetical protein
MESMVEDLYIFGTPEDCQDQVTRFVEAGVQNPIVAAPPTSRLTVDDVYGLIKAFGQ